MILSEAASSENFWLASSAVDFATGSYLSFIGIILVKFISFHITAAAQRRAVLELYRRLHLSLRSQLLIHAII